MGFSLNNLTLFGLVLAIGIVVDDAIVVLENIERWLEKGLPVREATIKAMNEITGPILAITLVLSSVFLPSAFLGGITGQFFRQFALTISGVDDHLGDQRHDDDAGPGRVDLRQPRSRGATRTIERQREALPWWFFGLFGGLGDCVAADADLGRAGWGCRSASGRRRAEPSGGLEGHDAHVGGLPASVPSRRDRRRRARLVHHPPGQLGPGQVLPRLQLGLRSSDAGLWQRPSAGACG